jgi:hypothetical protein
MPWTIAFQRVTRRPSSTPAREFSKLTNQSKPEIMRGFSARPCTER